MFTHSTLCAQPSKLLSVLLTKYYLGCSWDHVAVIVKDREEDLPYVLECNHEGKVQLTSFEERLLFCRDSVSVLAGLGWGIE